MATERDASPYWSQELEVIYHQLETSAGGLRSSEAQRRSGVQGDIVTRGHKLRAVLLLFLGQFKNPLIYILVIALTISMIVGEWVDVVVVAAVVVGSAVLSFIQEYNASEAVERLMRRIQARSTVLRDGAPVSIPADRVVPGDVVLLTAGSMIPGDGRIIDAKACCVDQAIMTGETFPVDKQAGIVPPESGTAERTNCLFMGTHVRSGTASLLVVHTGRDTMYGEIAARLSTQPPETGFERGIRQFGQLLVQIILILVLFVFAVNVIADKPAVDSLLFAIALAVGLAPEMLPAIITITLSQGAKRMADEGVIVRRLSAIEDFGNMDVLCTDKTGTLTEGRIRLYDAYDLSGAHADDVLRIAALNARLQVGIANPLDEAIVTAAAEADLLAEDVKKVDEVPYDFVRKRLTVVVADTPDSLRLIMKGAFESVLETCTFASGSGCVVPLSEELRGELRARFFGWSDQGYRVLGIAIRQTGQQRAYTRSDEHDMTFAGFLLFIDPPKAGAQETLDGLTRLGVDLKIVTGDNRKVAEYVAAKVGLNVTGVLSGTDLQQMRDEALWHRAERTTLFVEVDPNQKERIIRSLQKTGHVVGYLGDGINDAPALHAADVGVSVDQAVDVAKEAADLVLLEHNLDVLRDGIISGRRTFANTLKYVLTTTSANFGNMFSMAGLSLLLPYLPLLAKQILLNNFLSDLPGLAIANDEVDPEWVEKPRRWDIAFIRSFMIVFGAISSVFDFLTFGVLLLVFSSAPEQFRTGWFIESLLTELVIALVVRTRRPFFRSMPGRLLLVSTLIVAGITVALPYLPSVGTLFGFVPLPPVVMLMLVLITAGYVVAVELAKKAFYAHSGLNSRAVHA